MISGPKLRRSCPGEGNDLENGAVRIARDDDTEHRDQHNRETRKTNALLVCETDVEGFLHNILAHAARRRQKLGRRVDIVLARIPEITIPPMIAASTPKPESRLAISIRMFSEAEPSSIGMTLQGSACGQRYRCRQPAPLRE